MKPKKTKEQKQAKDWLQPPTFISELIWLVWWSLTPRTERSIVTRIHKISQVWVVCKWPYRRYSYIHIYIDVHSLINPLAPDDVFWHTRLFVIISAVDALALDGRQSISCGNTDVIRISWNAKITIPSNTMWFRKKRTFKKKLYFENTKSTRPQWVNSLLPDSSARENPLINSNPRLFNPLKPWL